MTAKENPDAEKNAEGSARLFFALWPETKTRNALAAWQQKLTRVCGGRAMKPWTLHLTLAFLGRTPEDKFEAVRMAAAGVRGTAFEMMMDRAGYWPQNRIVWVGCEAVPPALAEMQSGLAARLSASGIPFDAKPFQAHVTMLRNAHAPALTPGREMPQASVAWKARDFVLVESKPAPDIGPDSSRYQVIARFPLK